MHPNDADRMVNSVDPDQTAPLGLHCFSRPICLKLRIIMARIVREHHKSVIRILFQHIDFSVDLFELFIECSWF